MRLLAKSIPALLVSICLGWSISPVFGQGIGWVPTLEEAQQQAAQRKRLVLVHFWSRSCGPCLQLEKGVFNRSDVARAMGSGYVPVKVNVTESRQLAHRFNIRSIPTDVILTAEGEEVFRSVTPQKPDQYISLLDQVAAHSRVGRPAPAAGPAAIARSQESIPWEGSRPPPSGSPGPGASTERRDPSGSGPAVQGNPYLQTQTPAAPSPQAPPYADRVQTSRYGPSSEASASAAPPNRYDRQADPSAQNSPQNSRTPSSQDRYPQADNRYQGNRYQGNRYTGLESGQAPSSSAPATRDRNPRSTHQQQGRGQQGRGQEAAGGPPADRRYPGRPPAQQVAQNPTLNSPQHSAPSASSSDPRNVPQYGSPANPANSNSANPSNAGPNRSRPQSAQGLPPNGYVNNRQPTGTSRHGTASSPSSGRPSGSDSRSAVVPPRGALPPGSEAAPQNAPVGLDGFCPVLLVHERKWVPGNPRFTAGHRGRIYRFAGPKEQQAFQSNPEMYSPVLGGYDPVKYKEQGQLVEGQRKHGVFCYGRIFLFADEEALARFWMAPEGYLGPNTQ